jgi:hypothetical protein
MAEASSQEGSRGERTALGEKAFFLITRWNCWRQESLWITSSHWASRQGHLFLLQSSLVSLDFTKEGDENCLCYLPLIRNSTFLFLFLAGLEAPTPPLPLPGAKNSRPDSASATEASILRGAGLGMGPATLSG